MDPQPSRPDDWTTPPPGPVPADPVRPVGGETFWAALCHVAALGWFVLPIVGSIVGPLVVWTLKRHEYPLVDDQGKESLNFQLSMLIYTAVAGATVCVGIGLALLPALLVTDVVLIIVATVQASDGKRYRYPLTIRFIQ